MTASIPQQASTVRVLFGGDVMLGRLVQERILRSGPDYPLGQIAALMRQPDLTIVNLECAVTSSVQRWRGAPKAFYFGAPPQALLALSAAGVDMVSLANNHTLDFGVEGLLDTLRDLRRHGIRYAGAGSNAEQASSAAIIACAGMQFGMAAFCDHQSDFAAQQDRPGIAYLDLDDVHGALAAWRRALEPLRKAAVDWPILSLHWGPNMAFRPSDKFRQLAHAAIDMGWKILFGHSAHVFQAIEIYRGCPIIYAAGDLVDDYYVDPVFRNDHQLLFEMALSGRVLKRIDLHPVFIQDCQTRLANPEQSGYVFAHMRAMCQEMGTRVRQEGEQCWIAGTDA